MTAPLISEIVTATSAHFEVATRDLLGGGRSRAIARPRQIAMYLAKQMTDRSWPEIGRRFGGRDHTTVIYAARHIAQLRELDREINDAIRSVAARALELAVSRVAALPIPEPQTEEVEHV